MRGALLDAPRTIRVGRDLPDPVVTDSRDAIVRVTRAGICGTDLHAYRGHIPRFRAAVLMGHEAVGVVEEVGSGVQHIRVGERVCISDLIACCHCWWCVRGLHYQCPEVTLFGFGDVVGPYVPGLQAERVRVPLADKLLLRVPTAIGDDEAVFGCDVAPTAYACIKNGGVSEGHSVAIFGCGPVGLTCGVVALAYGADRVYAVDPVPLRRSIAEQVGLTPIDSGRDVVTLLRRETSGRGVDIALECVGDEAPLHAAISSVRGGGTVSVVGSHHSTDMPFSAKDAFARELRMVFSVGNPLRDGETVLSLMADKTVDVRPLISMQMALDDAPRAYEIFDRSDAVKILLIP